MWSLTNGLLVLAILNAGVVYLTGSCFTAADIPAGTAFHRYFSIGLPVEEPPNVMAWFARLRERPAFCQNILVPFDELYGRLAF